MACLDVNETNDPDCFSNVTWAMTEGVNINPTWYADYPILSEYPGFKAYQYVLHQKVGPGVEDQINKPDGKGYSCPLPCGIEPKACYDIVDTSPGQCYDNVLWAKQTGIITHPDYYADWPALTEDSSFGDFQFVLSQKVDRSESGKPDGEGWQCPKPCTCQILLADTSSACAPLTAPPTPAPPVESLPSATVPPVTTSTTFGTIPTTTTTTEASSSFPWWAWLLCVCALLACIGGLVAFFMMGKGKKDAAKKKKRGTTPAKTAPPAAPQQREPVAQSLIAQPVQTAVTTAPPVYTAAQPAYQQVYTAAPVQATAVPVQTYQTRGMPVYQAQAQAASLFDQLDRDHNGVITRAEFERAMGR